MITVQLDSIFPIVSSSKKENIYYQCGGLFVFVRNSHLGFLSVSGAMQPENRCCW